LTLKRVIQKYVQDPLAEMMLACKVHDDESVKITSAKDGLTAPRKRPRRLSTSAYDVVDGSSTGT
jgi:ATP-dependent Clp protease ATP-binding subunit ClpB